MNRKIKENILYILDISIKNKRKFYSGVFFSLLSAIVSLLIPLMVGKILDDLVNVKKHIQIENFVVILLVFFGIYVFQGLSSYVLGMMGVDAVRNLQSFFYEHILNLELGQVYEYASGDIASRATNDVSEVSSIVTIVIPGMIKNALLVICTIIILWLLNKKLTILIMIMLIMILLVSHPVNGKLEKLYKIHQTILGNISAEVTRCFSNMIVVKAFVSEKNEYQCINILCDKLKSNMNKIIKNETIWNVFLSCALMCNMVLIILFAKTGFVKEHNAISILSAYILYLVQLLSPAVSLVNSITEFVESNGALQRITEVINLPRESKSEVQNVDLIEGNIKFSYVNFRYNGSSVGLNNINIDIPKGSMVAIVGPSGVGKTTLFSLILKLYKNYEGKIAIDSFDIRDLSTDLIRRRIAYVSQDNLVINGTVMDNLRYGKNDFFEPEEIQKNLVENDMMVLFDDFSEGLHTYVGEDGNKLSEGQKQRINIARAIISQPIILLLDEITSNLDAKTERVIMDLIERQKKKSTIVIIAHRLNTVINSDLIYVLNTQGKIECFGTHQYLLENSETYKQLTISLQ